MLKIIFMAIMLGIACGALSDRIKVLKDFLTDAYMVVEKITQIIIRVMPFAIFCSMAKMVISMDACTLLSVFSWVPVTFVANVATGNVTGLGAVTLIVAKKEKMLNMDIYNK